LYTTTRDTGVPAVASAIVAAPAHPPAGPRPVIAWTHGTTGVAEDCAPSLLPRARQKLDYLTYPGRNHVGLVAADSPLIPALIAWTQDRLAAKPVPDNCPAT
jgi:hypothetical protein